MELSNLKILIADDHKLFAEGLTYLLKQELSIESIDTVYNGKSAIGKVLNTDYNIIFMDVNMPLLNGIETCAEIKRFRTQTKIVFVSMKADMLTVAQALKAGADAYLLKGNDHNDFIKAFKQIYNNEIFLSEQIKHYFQNDNPNQIRKNAIAYLDYSNSLISAREKEIIKLVCDGLTSDKIGEVLSISTRTVDTHRNNILNKLKLNNIASLVRFALENKLVD